MVPKDWDEDAYMEPWLRLEADRHFVFVAAFDLVRAIEFLNCPRHVDSTELDAIRHLRVSIKTLRDCTEHWDEEVLDWVRRPSPLSGRAFTELAQLGPTAEFRAHRWTASGSTTVAGVLSLDDLRSAVTQAREFFAKLASGWFIDDGWPAP